MNRRRSSQPRHCRGAGPPETAPAPSTLPSPFAENRWMTSGSFPQAVPAPSAASTRAPQLPSAPSHPPLPRTERNSSKISANLSGIPRSGERIRGENSRGACAGCSGKAGGGLKKVRGAGIWPSTGTGSAFLPRIAASEEEIQRDSHLKQQFSIERVQIKLSSSIHLKEGSTGCC